MSQNDTKFYIDGAWVAPAAPKLFDVINPATEEVAGRIYLNGAPAARGVPFGGYKQSAMVANMACSALRNISRLKQCSVIKLPDCRLSMKSETVARRS